jgi:uncharacterized protein (TIGR00369 family)
LHPRIVAHCYKPSFVLQAGTMAEGSDTDILARWLEEEAEVRARMAAGPGAGVATPAQLAGRSGLQALEAMLRGDLPYPAISQTLDFALLRVAPGEAVFQGTPSAAHFNPMGTVHGGWFATLLDSALGCAVHTLMPEGRGYTTAELSVKLVRALTPKVQRVRAEGRVLHAGRQLATAEARLVDATGKLYAHATTVCLVFDNPT